MKVILDHQANESLKRIIDAALRGEGSSILNDVNAVLNVRQVYANLEVNHEIPKKDEASLSEGKPISQNRS